MIIGIANIIGCKNTNGSGQPPLNIVLPSLSGSPVVGQVLTCSDGTWTGTIPITFTYQWQRNGSDIIGEVASTYTLVQADAGNSISCVVYATNTVTTNSVSSDSFSIMDADAQAFLTAAAITDPTITSAINNLTIELKTNGIWIHMHAIYPFVGGTATTHKWNLKSPLDTDAAFRLTFFGGMTHSSNGITGNALNAYALTHLNASVTIPNNGTIGVYIRTNIAEMAYDITNIVGGTEQSVISRWSTNLFYVNSGSATYPNVANTDSRGLFTMSYNSNVRGYKNAISVINESKASSGANNTFKIGGTGFSNYSSKNYAFAFIATNMNATEKTSVYNSIQTFETTLGRQV
jgi:hypothetical protein